eukprot:1572516-Alexandrium_andersonii.AAC.1
MAASSSADCPEPGAHPWEQPGYGHVWEQPGYGEDADSDTPTAQELAEQSAMRFLDGLLDLYLESKIAAKDVCVLSWHAARGGMVGPVRDFGMAPNSKSTGNYQRHLDKLLGFGRADCDFFEVECPGYAKRNERKPMQIPVNLPHEVLEQDLREDASLLLRLQEAQEDGSLPPCYYTHPVVKGAAPGE